MSLTSLEGSEAPREGGAHLGAAAVVIWNDVAPEGREAFYAWHDREHIPERLGVPGFLRGRRFIRPGHSPEWLTLYETRDPAVLTSPAYLARLNAPTPATVATLVHFRNTSRAACRLAHSVGASTGGHVLALRLAADDAQGDALRTFVVEQAFPQAMRITGVVACHLYRADDSASYVKTAESSNREFDVPSWIVLCEASLETAAVQARNLIEGPELAELGVAVRSDAAVYGLEVCRLARARESRD